MLVERHIRLDAFIVRVFGNANFTTEAVNGGAQKVFVTDNQRVIDGIADTPCQICAGPVENIRHSRNRTAPDQLRRTLDHLSRKMF